MGWHRTWNEPPAGRGGFFADRGGWFSPGVRLLLILMGLAALVLIPCREWLLAHAAVSADGLARFQLWRLVTYMFLHTSGFHLIIVMLLVWLLGTPLEREIGLKSLLALFVASGVLGGLAEAGFNWLRYAVYGGVLLGPYGHTFLTLPAIGANAPVAAVLLALVVLKPRAKFSLMGVLPLEAWMAAVVYFLFEAVRLALDLTRARADFSVNAAFGGGAVLGLVWVKWGAGLAALLERRVGPQRGLIRRRTGQEQAELDRILDKIHRSGVESLSAGEKMFLQEMSEKYRGKF
jgi:membrane associated rhomboid family serine protease